MFACCSRGDEAVGSFFAALRPPGVGRSVRSDRSTSMMATARATAAAAAAAGGPAWGGSALRDHADAARDHAPHGCPGVGVPLERRVHHRLLDLEAERFLPGFLRDGLVDVGGHWKVKVKGKGKVKVGGRSESGRGSESESERESGSSRKESKAESPGASVTLSPSLSSSLSPSLSPSLSLLTQNVSPFQPHMPRATSMNFT